MASWIYERLLDLGVIMGLCGNDWLSWCSFSYFVSFVPLILVYVGAWIVGYKFGGFISKGRF